ncbi:S1 RNA-binding domain-containing protein [Allobaculum sp. Allo2]|uniref:S1 RNA-binding domain-containing protein n=1 Tax=Allobaculum sp. Allo2 TaxID=2853432 RepID=UPI001F60E533|nr:S1 RNA-binding domain-containing protein [Allobaculum sp. Allo2]
MLRRHVIHKKNDEKSLLKDEKRMEKSSMHLSEKEKDAVTIERAVNDLEFAKYMENKVGEVYDGLIVGVTSFGFFVELDNTVEGMVPLRNMIDDFYNYDADTMMLTGENTGKTFTLGMPVRIKVRDVQTAKRQITFDYLETLPSRSAMRPSTPVIETAEPKPEEQPEEEILQAEIVSEERDVNVTITETEVQAETPAKNRLPRRILKKPKICLPSKRRMTICRR